MKPQYNETKASQVAFLLLKLRGGTMSYMKLMKLMYLIDRTALIKWGRSVTFDSVVSMDNGLVLSKTYNLIREDKRPDSNSIWREFITEASNYEVSAKDIETDFDELSDAEEELIKEVFDRYGAMGRWELVDKIHHNLPEWIDPKGSSIPLTYRDILVKSNERSYSDIEEIESELDSIALLDCWTC